MIPLVSLFSDASQPEEVRKWKVSIETALHFFETCKDYSIAAKRSGDAVARLYQAYKAYASSASQTPQPMPMATPQQYHAHVGYPTSNMASAQMVHPHMRLSPDQQHMYQYHSTQQSWGSASDPILLNNFWDDMMWDTSLPDIQETPFGLSNEYEYGGTAHDQGHHSGSMWMHGS